MRRSNWAPTWSTFAPKASAISTASLTAKIVPLPIGGGGFGLALSGAFVYDLTDKNINSVILNVPLTYDFGKHLRFNINVGAQYIRGDYAISGRTRPGCSPPRERASPGTW